MVSKGCCAIIYTGLAGVALPSWVEGKKTTAAAPSSWILPVEVVDWPRMAAVPSKVHLVGAEAVFRFGLVMAA